MGNNPVCPNITELIDKRVKACLTTDPGVAAKPWEGRRRGHVRGVLSQQPRVLTDGSAAVSETKPTAPKRSITRRYK